MKPYDGKHHMTATLGVLGLAAIFGFVFLASRLGIAFAIPVGIIGAGATAVALHGPLGKAIARRLEGAEPSVETPPELLLGELDELRGRLQELEERVDFSERLLAQQSRVPDR
ncbi:MAG TPA: hypothetical protein VE078_00975 [Thermoanaerobaculia bacterium]|nr:hypothetical protein [Thermoanaerobaculia bacterium]